MRLEMGLCWCEVVIKGLQAKRWLLKLAPVGVGIAFTGGISAILFQSRYVDAAPCCMAHALTPTSLPEASEKSTQPDRNVQNLKETGGSEQYTSRLPPLPVKDSYSTVALGKGDAQGEHLLDSAVSPPEYNYDHAFATNTLSAIASPVRPVESAQPSTASPETLDHWQPLEPESQRFPTQSVAWEPTSGSTEHPKLNFLNKSVSELLGTQEKVGRDSLLTLEDVSSVSLSSLSSPELVLLSSASFTQKTVLQAQNPTVPPPVSPENLQPNPNQDRFLQSPPSPSPITPDANQPNQSLPTPRLEIPDSPSPVQPTPTPTSEPFNATPSAQPLPIPTLEIPDSPSPIQPAPTPIPTTPETPQPTPTPTPTTPPSEQTIQVKKIRVTGSTIFGPNELNPIVQPYEGRTLTLEQLREAADKITQLYLDQGYITSRAILADQSLAEGVVEIAAIEGSLQDIQVEGTRRLKPSYVRSRVQLGAGKPLNTGKLEDQLRLLRADPLFENVEASLRAGTGVGQSILIVRVVEADPFEGSVGIDNYSPPSVGSERLGLNLLYRNLTGYGDEIAASYYHTTTSGADSFDFSYRIPLNPMNGTLQLRAAPSRNKITQESSRALGIRGQSELYEINFRQPLIRSPREEFALSLGFTYQDGQTFIFNDVPFPFGFGPDENGVSSTRVIKFGQDYLRRDVRGAWSLRSLFSIGIGALGATINPEPTPDGRFVSWLGQVQRVQILNEDNFLIVGADIQLTPNSLLPSQQFVIGGGQSLRGYRQNIRSGDNGVRFSVEDRITLQRNESGASIFQLAPFFDAGVVWNKPDNRNNDFLPTQRFLAGIGMGLIWEAQPGLSLRLDYGYPLIKIDDRGDNAQDQGFYFSVRYQF
jgi:hemolysin activation/secretion protein